MLLLIFSVEITSDQQSTITPAEALVMELMPQGMKELGLLKSVVRVGMAPLLVEKLMDYFFVRKKLDKAEHDVQHYQSLLQKAEDEKKELLLRIHELERLVPKPLQQTTPPTAKTNVDYTELLDYLKYVDDAAKGDFSKMEKEGVFQKFVKGIWESSPGSILKHLKEKLKQRIPDFFRVKARFQVANAAYAALSEIAFNVLPYKNTLKIILKV
jgi:hypothetical protein